MHINNVLRLSSLKIKTVLVKREYNGRKGVNRFFSLLMTVMFFAFSLCSMALAEENSTVNDKTITGVVIKVDVKNRSIYIRENSRIVKFKASLEICEQYKGRINSEVDITYKIGNNKRLQIITIKPAEKKEEAKTAPVKQKAAGRIKKTNN